MKLHFEDNLDYQLCAIESVTELFCGQDINHTEFTLSKALDPSSQLEMSGLEESNLGIGNRLQLSDTELLENLKRIQIKNGLPPSESLASGDFTVEMETGTGKTYVYLRTIFELNRRYGFTKFMIVVPSVAIKEGTYKTLHITREHFENLYPSAKGYEYFLYDSKKLGQVRNYATSSNIQIMVVTVGAINKKEVNNLYKDSEKTGGEKPIDLVRATHPIIIVDEPQSVDGGLQGQGKKALDDMNPLCTLRYSATHTHKHHMLYRLDAVDAYERKLVKQIEVAALQVEGDHNRPYVKLLSTHNQRGSISAKIEVDIESKTGVRRQTITVEDGDDLGLQTGRALYKNCRIGTITCGKTKQSMEVSSPLGEFTLTPGGEVGEFGGANRDELKRLMIRRTIKEHFDKEVRFAAQKRGVKVLSLFFIDSVKHYRQYDPEGNATKGKYASMFEEEYRQLIKLPQYNSIAQRNGAKTNIEDLHNGYFSIDKKGAHVETTESNQAGRDNAERAYNLIMKDKEKLLSFDSKLKFIFSHSALREGWDNPNVFQICTLREMGSERERRQTIGRGLRLCVNQQGQRLRGFDINTLTVIANESYEQFAENLQSEIEQDTGIRFGVVEKHQFAALATTRANGEYRPLGVQESEQLWEYLQDNEFINASGKIQDTLRLALAEDKLALPPEFSELAPQIKEVLRKLAGKLGLKNADQRITVKTRKEVLQSEEFISLWDKIKHKTTYRVNFDNLKLIEDCAKSIQNCPPITKTRAQFRKAGLAIGKSGIAATETATSEFTSISESDIELPDILTALQDKTNLTRRSIVAILRQSRRLNDFKRNPQQFIELATDAINRTKRLALVDGISYQRIGNDHYYVQELFESEELTAYLKNSVVAQKSVYTHIVYDISGIEQRFAQDLETNEAVKVYTKLPAWFKIPTPLGTYNPDWAALIEIAGEEKLYFVIETKSSLWWDDLRDKERAKMKCGKRHFDELKATKDQQEAANFITAKSVNEILQRQNSGDQEPTNGTEGI